MKRVISIVLCLVLALSLCGCEKMDYNKAVELYEAGGYEGAKAAFEALGDYEDSAEYAAKAQLVLDYRNAIELYAEEKYSEAAEAFEALGDYEDSAEYLAKLQDKLLLEKITGRWQTEEIDMTNLILGSIKEEMAALGYDEINFDVTNDSVSSIEGNNNLRILGKGEFVIIDLDSIFIQDRVKYIEYLNSLGIDGKISANSFVRSRILK